MAPPERLDECPLLEDPPEFELFPFVPVAVAVTVAVEVGGRVRVAPGKAYPSVAAPDPSAAVSTG